MVHTVLLSASWWIGQHENLEILLALPLEWSWVLYPSYLAEIPQRSVWVISCIPWILSKGEKTCQDLSSFKILFLANFLFLVIGLQPDPYFFKIQWSHNLMGYLLVSHQRPQLTVESVTVGRKVGNLWWKLKLHFNFFSFRITGATQKDIQVIFSEPLVYKASFSCLCRLIHLRFYHSIWFILLNQSQKRNFINKKV